MDILKLAIIHDMALMEFYALGHIANVLDIEASKGESFAKIYGI